MRGSDKVDWERFGRASKAIAPEIVELNEWRGNPTSLDVASYYCQVLVHRAHTVMLAEEGVIEREEAVQIIEGIKEVKKEAMGNPSLVGLLR